MLLQKYENLLELSVKQLVLVLQSSLASSISLWCVKNQMLMLFVAKLELSKSKSNLIPFKNPNPNHYPKVLFKSFPTKKLNLYKK